MENTSVKKRHFNAIKNISMLALMLAMGSQLKAQVAIHGSQCIIPGTTYQYYIKGNGSDTSSLKVNIKGGELASGVSSSTDRVRVSSVFVIWKDTSYHQIEVQSKKGNSTLLVNETTVLNGGKIDTADNVRKYNAAVTAYTFHCSRPTGGACTPGYIYQWQKSEDGFKWIDLANAKEKDLSFSNKIKADTYFRRVTTETKSNTIGYSNIGVIQVAY